MSNQRFQPGAQHPEQWRQDLNPDANAGVNYGLLGDEPENFSGTAYDDKDAHRYLQGYTDDELKQITVLPEGARLEQGATYIDLADLGRGEFTAMGGMEAGPENRYVPKSKMDYQLWNRLIGVENPERLGEADDGANS